MILYLPAVKLCQRKKERWTLKKPFVTLEQLQEMVKTYPTPFHLYDEKGIRANARLCARPLPGTPATPSILL